MNCPFFLILDSDGDNFLSLKKAAASKQNGLSKSTKAAAGSARPGVKTPAKSPIKPSATPSKTPLKSPVTPKSAEPKKNPTSVFNYFGSATIQRSDKKLVASAKRKAVSGSDDHLNYLLVLVLNLGNPAWLGDDWFCMLHIIFFSRLRIQTTCWATSKSPERCRWTETWRWAVY